MCNNVSLYNCLYGMELYKNGFISYEVKKKCIVDLIEFYNQMHNDNKIVGLFSPKQFWVDLSTGDIETGININVEEGLKDCDVIKFIPPEIIKREGEWDIAADRFCLALLVYSIYFFSFPFDGKRIYKNPILSSKRAIEEYSNPVFAFDIVDTSNSIEDSTDYNVRKMWNDESNQELKDAFVKSFTCGVSNKDLRVSDAEWLKIFGVKSEKSDISPQYIMSVNNVQKILQCGTEIFEKDIFGGDSNSKIGVVVTSKKDSSIMALGNASTYIWRLQLPDNQEMMIPPNSVAPLTKGTVITINDTVIDII